MKTARNIAWLILTLALAWGCICVAAKVFDEVERFHHINDHSEIPEDNTHYK